MKAFINSEGAVCLAFDSQQEIDAVWALASHVGGGTHSLRTVFSTLEPTQPTLLEVLFPFVSKTAGARLPSQPGDAAPLLAALYGQCLDGTGFFRPVRTRGPQRHA